jgi:hypothetical protein
MRILMFFSAVEFQRETSVCENSGEWPQTRRPRLVFSNDWKNRLRHFPMIGKMVSYQPDWLGVAGQPMDVLRN